MPISPAAIRAAKITGTCAIIAALIGVGGVLLVSYLHKDTPTVSAPLTIGQTKGNVIPVSTNNGTVAPVIISDNHGNVAVVSGGTDTTVNQSITNPLPPPNIENISPVFQNRLINSNYETQLRVAVGNPTSATNFVFKFRADLFRTFSKPPDIIQIGHGILMDGGYDGNFKYYQITLTTSTVLQLTNITDLILCGINP